MIYILAIAFLFIGPRDVHAYLDPGSGSLLIQLVIGIFLGGAYFIKVFWHKILKLVLSLFGKNNDEKKKQSK